jgi:hypothetical protein
LIFLGAIILFGWWSKSLASCAYSRRAKDQTFAEDIPALAERYASLPIRLKEVLESLALADGGRTRLTPHGDLEDTL